MLDISTIGDFLDVVLPLLLVGLFDDVVSDAVVVDELCNQLDSVGFFVLCTQT